MRPEPHWTCSRATSRRPASKRSTRRFSGCDGMLKSTDWTQPPPGRRYGLPITEQRYTSVVGVSVICWAFAATRISLSEVNCCGVTPALKLICTSCQSGLKPSPLDRLDDAHERATAGKLPLTRVTHVDRVDRSVVGEVRRLAARSKLHEVDREERGVVVGRHRPRDAVHAASPGGSSEQREHCEHSR